MLGAAAGGGQSPAGPLPLFSPSLRPGAAERGKRWGWWGSFSPLGCRPVGPRGPPAGARSCALCGGGGRAGPGVARGRQERERSAACGDLSLYSGPRAVPGAKPAVFTRQAIHSNDSSKKKKKGGRGRGS